MKCFTRVKPESLQAFLNAMCEILRIRVGLTVFTIVVWGFRADSEPIDRNSDPEATGPPTTVQ